MIIIFDGMIGQFVEKSYIYFESVFWLYCFYNKTNHILFKLLLSSMAQQADENQFLSGLSADIFAGQGVDDAALQELLKVLGSRGYLPQVGG